MSTRLTLQPGGWYGWTMWPGYGGTPYHSPIRVEAVTPYGLGDRQFELTFFNMGYAAGVQMMTYTLRTLRREETYILVALIDSDRSVAIVPLDREWMSIYAPRMIARVDQVAGDWSSLNRALDKLWNFEAADKADHRII